MSGDLAATPIDLKTFLETTPEHQVRVVTIDARRRGDTQPEFDLVVPAIWAYCDGDCSRYGYFDPEDERISVWTSRQSGGTIIDHRILHWSCRNCEQTSKTFALHLYVPRGRNWDSTLVKKLGQDPAFGDPDPKTLTRILQLQDQQSDEADLFRKGHECENRGYGIGAFVYYRRVLELRRGALIEAVEKAAQLENSPEDVMEAIARAKRTDKFSRAVEELKDMLPATLRIDGHNPLRLLYETLSDGVHEHNDAECLERAQTTRSLLIALTARLDTVTAEHSELRRAIAKMTDWKNPRKRQK